MGCALQPALTTLPRQSNLACFVLTLVFAGPKTGQVQPVRIGVLDFGGPCYPPASQ